MSWAKNSSIVVSAMVVVITFGASAAHWTIAPLYGGVLFAFVLLGSAFVAWVWVGASISWFAVRGHSTHPTLGIALRTISSLTVAAIMTQEITIPPVFGTSCAPKIEGGINDTPIKDPQLGTPAIVRWFLLTRLSRKSYDMIVQGVCPGLLNLNVIRSGEVTNKSIKRQMTPLGIELLINDPVGITGIIISPPPKETQRLLISFKCAK